MIASSSIATSIARRPCFSFFALAYAWSWTAWLLASLSPQTFPGRICLYAGVFGPALAAAVVGKAKYGSLRDWLRGVVRWRVPLKWYLFALGVPMLFALAISAEFALVGNTVDISLLAARLPDYLPMLAFTAILGGGNEEPGWRGSALPHLQSSFGPIGATLLLGVAWALWHLPLLVVNPSARHGFSSPIELLAICLVTLVSIVGYAFWYTWLYNRTRSTLLCLLLHAGINTSNGLLILLPDQEMHGASYQALLWLSTSTLLVSVAALLAGTRGRLGWNIGHREPHVRCRANDMPATAIETGSCR